MTSFDPSSDELVSAYLDGEATDAERARVEADPELRSRVETFRLVSSAVATPPVLPDAAARDAAIAAALGASNTTAKVTSLAPVQERRSRFSGAKTGVLSAAAVILVLFLGAAIVGNLGGNDSEDTASGADASTDDAVEFDAGATATMESDGGGDDSESMEDQAFDMEEEAMDDEEAMADEAMGDVMDDDSADDDSADDGAAEEEEAMEDEAMADDETSPADSSDGDDPEAPFAPRIFTSLGELIETYTAEEIAGQRAAAEFSPEVIEMSDQCRQEQNELDTNSLVFLEPAILLDPQQVEIDVLVYRDDIIDADPFIRVFEFETCAVIP